MFEVLGFSGFFKGDGLLTLVGFGHFDLLLWIASTNNNLTGRSGTPMARSKVESEVGYPFSERGEGVVRARRREKFQNFDLSEGPGTD